MLVVHVPRPTYYHQLVPIYKHRGREWNAQSSTIFLYPWMCSWDTAQVHSYCKLQCILYKLHSVCNTWRTSQNVASTYTSVDSNAHMQIFTMFSLSFRDGSFAFISSTFSFSWFNMRWFLSISASVLSLSLNTRAL